MTELLHGDAAESLSQLADASVHCVVTSPPYWALRSYLPEGDPRKALELGTEESPDCLGWATGAKCGQRYLCRLMAVLEEVRRVLRGDGVAFLVLGDSHFGSSKGRSQAPSQSSNRGSLTGRSTEKIGRRGSLSLAPARVALAAYSQGWIVRSVIIWAKGASLNPRWNGSPMPESVAGLRWERRDQDSVALRRAAWRPTRAYEEALMFTKQTAYWADAGEGKEASIGEERGGMRNLRNVFALDKPCAPADGHYARFPEPLVRRLIAIACPERRCARCGAGWARVMEGAVTVDWRPTCRCGCQETRPGVVLDPFAGSGTTLVVAKKMGRDAIGIELAEEYIALAQRRLAETQGLFEEGGTA